MIVKTIKQLAVILKHNLKLKQQGEQKSVYSDNNSDETVDPTNIY